jgi:hypothetical protein
MQGSTSPLIILLLSSPRNIAEAAVVAKYLLVLLWDMGTHGLQPFKGVKGFLALAALEPADHLGVLMEVSHPFGFDKTMGFSVHFEPSIG